VTGFGRLESWDEPDPYGLTEGVIRAFGNEVPPLEVVLAPSVTSYRLAGYAPVRIVVAPPGHVAFNTEADYRNRSRAAREFFLEPSITSAERSEILDRYGADWVLLDKSRGLPPLPADLRLAYQDERYALYEVEKEPA